MSLSGLNFQFPVKFYYTLPLVSRVVEAGQAPPALAKRLVAHRVMQIYLTYDANTQCLS